MTASNLLAELRRRGLKVSARGDRLRVVPRGKVTPDVVATIRQHKPAILAALRAEANTTASTAPRAKVLILLHPDGWCEAYAAKDVDIHVLQVWGENCAEGSADDQTGRLPECYARLHLPGNLRATGFPKYKSRPGDWRSAAIDRYLELTEKSNNNA
ncbi:MAG: hypothetical protein K8T25_00510 [Planctomycetia bacterium]|nr:hypothetical protein [Planctomycetia bacterium]